MRPAAISWRQRECLPPQRRAAAAAAAAAAMPSLAGGGVRMALCVCVGREEAIAWA